MSQVISLHDHGVRLFACRLYNHDYLWFSSYEISKLSTALPVLHNYALTYSLGDFSYGISWETAPHYEEDLAYIPLYATPALAAFWSRTRITYNAVNTRSLCTDDAPRGINSPDLGWRNYLDPVYPTDVLAAQQLGFACYVFTFDGRRPKGVTRLGKKGATIRVRWEEIERPLAVFQDEPVRPTHPLNPLDISGQVISYEPVNIPPHLLLRTAEVQDDWFIFARSHRVHVPRRVMERCQA
ncbi:MAG: type I-D CRISPR-associated protein Cas5/Csc1 [Chloroflexi bacterium]|nr:type I-D CRISPR-associated protein Cas5/Csc1 [Chloroflexota bacterium]